MADVPLWFAGVTAGIPIVAGLPVLWLTNRHARQLRELDSVDKQRDRDHTVRIEIQRELRAERRDLYRRLIATAKRVLDIDQPMVDKVTRALLKFGREQQGLGSKVGDIFAEWAPFDEWRLVLAEAEFQSSDAVVEAVRAVADHAHELTQRRTNIRSAQAAGDPVEFDPDKEDAIVAESRRIVGRLIEACAADMGAR